MLCKVLSVNWPLQRQWLYCSRSYLHISNLLDPQIKLQFIRHLFHVNMHQNIAILLHKFTFIIPKIYTKKKKNIQFFKFLMSIKNHTYTYMIYACMYVYNKHINDKSSNAPPLDFPTMRMSF